LASIGPNKTKKTSFFVSHDVIFISNDFTESEDCTTGGNNGSIDITVSGGSGTYTFAWEKDGVTGFSTDEDIFSLSAGTYRVEISDGICTTEKSFVVSYSCPYSCSGVNISFTNIINTDCANANGSLEADVSAGEFTYELNKYSSYSGTSTLINSGADTGPTSLTFTGLESGEYELYIYETVGGCFAYNSTTVGATDLSFNTANFTANSSCSTPNGQLVVTIDNTTAPNNFTYRVKNTFTGNEVTRNSTALSESFAGLVSGHYQIEVTDIADGCVIETSGNVVNSTPLTLTLNSTTNQTTCSPANGGADISVTGGTGNYTYAWSRGAITQDLTNAIGGTYTVSVFDQTSRCSGFLSNIVIPNNTVLPTLNTSVTNNTNCSAPYNGSINLTVSTTPGPHLYEWLDEESTVISTIEDLTNLAPGSYSVKVTNQPTGCANSISFFGGTVSDLSVPNISITQLLDVSNTLCSETPGNGAISVLIDAGGFPYTTIWTSPFGFSATNVEDLTDLATGDYELTVEVACSSSPPVLTSTTTERDYTGIDVVIDNVLNISDSDSPDLQSAEVYFNSGYRTGEDVLVFVNQSGLSGAFDASTGILTINGNASLAAYQTALRNVQYRNTANPRSKSLRTIGFNVNDGVVKSNSLLITLAFPNQLPVLAGSAQQGLYGTGQYVVFPNVVLTDVDDANLASAQIVISSGLQANSDLLQFDPQPGISGNFDSATGVLTLTGSSALINYQNVLRSVQFSNANSAITFTTRQIQFTVQDGTGASNVISASVAINQPPIIAAPANPFSNTIISLELTLLISDPNNNIDFNTLAIASPPLSGAQASLNGTLLSLDYSSINFSGTDQFGLEVCDLLGLCATQTLTIEIEGLLTIFNAVSTNGDNLNAYFYLRNIKPGNRVTIYNRWGNVVWEGEDYDNDNVVFTGLNKNGNELVTGTYYYKIEFESGRKAISGFLSLKR
jgi:gliding motility-associated-like protein